ncbi:MAG: helix-hairpin-helix domain-containing protein, partial [Desulfitobacteriaceae bacterium]|nr:helix-hairpin-helix domain-containing protein [Desulfitobacteriaceae bacterium]
GKEQVKSLIDDIPGIGPARKKALMNAFGSLPRLAEADLEEIVMVEGMNRKAAEAVFNFLQEHKK